MSPYPKSGEDPRKFLSRLESYYLGKKRLTFKEQAVYNAGKKWAAKQLEKEANLVQGDSEPIVHTLRADLTPAERALPLTMTIDPGFVHHSKIEAILGSNGMQMIDAEIAKIPDMPDGLKQGRINNIFSRIFVAWCGQIGIRSLRDTLAMRNGKMFCSTESLLPCADVYSAERATSRWKKPENVEYDVELQYSTARISSDTLRHRLSEGGDHIAIVAELRDVQGNHLVYEPIVMGAPWLEAPSEIAFDPAWYSQDFFENYIEDFDEFSRTSEIPEPGSAEQMQYITEEAFKTCLARILGDSEQPDWGGESSDYFSAHLHLRGRRVKAAFLLKGPARFAPMGLNHLGKNNDQVVRLSHEPADVLVVQHCHDILPPVRETLRAFAVQPSRPRRYCLIDGRDSLRLLQAYGLYEEAVRLSAA